MSLDRPLSAPGLIVSGAVIGSRYQVVRSLGRGGMGHVYEVEHAAIGRRFALKLIALDPCTEEMEQRFMREARALGYVESPRVARVTDFGHQPGLGLYYVMEYIEGETLEDRLEREIRLRPMDAIELGIELAGAIQDVHDAGIIHRDVKPSNIALPTSGDIGAKLLDFGLAVSTEHSCLERITKDKALLGSLYYMAPELIQDEPLSPAMDLYSLGAVLFEALTGRPPFDDPSAIRLMRMHLMNAVPPFSDAAPGVEFPVLLEAVVARLLDKDPCQRFSSAAAVVRALQGVP